MPLVQLLLPSTTDLPAWGSCSVLKHLQRCVLLHPLRAHCLQLDCDPQLSPRAPLLQRRRSPRRLSCPPRRSAAAGSRPPAAASESSLGRGRGCMWRRSGTTAAASSPALPTTALQRRAAEQPSAGRAGARPHTQVQQQAVGRQRGAELLLQVVGSVQQRLQLLGKLPPLGLLLQHRAAAASASWAGQHSRGRAFSAPWFAVCR